MTAKLSDAKSIFLAAIHIGQTERRANYVKQACGENADLHERVYELLWAHENSDSLLERGAGNREGTRETIELNISERPGTQIGPYKLLQQIGEGGMGVVYMAEQSKPVERRVALKIIKPGMDTGQVIARFEAERQALAMMDHPNIAKVLDAGATDSGRPYFVMELVKGIPISEYCDEQHFTAKKRLELFVQVCHAVQHAHQKGIIHRDLKPSNVLVAEYDHRAVPKIIDFGVAKATSQKLTEKTMFTQYGQIVGTLEYMSPEQAKLNQLDIDTRSDLYSLGVLLYQLLTGTTPFDRERLQSVAFDEMLRIIREEEPPKPSTRISTLGKSAAALSASRRTNPQRLRQVVHGELDWIVMKALEKERARRYETAQGFADDVQRYLDDEAVQACPPSMVYQARKFVRRHRGPVSAGILLLLLLSAGAIGTTTGWVNAVKERREADNQRLGAIAARDAARAAERREAEQRKLAVAQGRRAEESREREKQLRRDAELQKYVSDMGLAYRVLNEGNVVDAEALLQKYAERPDVRSYEWGFLWRMCQGDTLSSRTQQYEVRSLAVSPDGRWIATTCDNRNRAKPPTKGVLTLYTAEPLLTPTILQQGANPATCAAFSPDSKTLITGHRDGSLTVRSGVGFEDHDSRAAHEDILSAIAFSPNKTVLATGSKDNQVIVRNFPDFEKEKRCQLDFSVYTMAFDCNGRILAASGLGGIVALIDIAKPELQPQLVEPRSAHIRSLAFSPVNEHQLAMGYQDGIISCLDAATNETTVVGSHLLTVNSVAFLPDGKRLVSASSDHTIRLWDFQARKQLGVPLKGHRDEVGQVAPSPDGSLLYSVGFDKTMKAWSAAPASTSDVLHVTSGTEFWVRGVEFLDGKSVVVGSHDGTIQFWDVISRGLMNCESALSEYIPGFACHPNSDLIAVGNTAGAVQIWDARTYKVKKTFQAHRHRVFRLEFSPDGKYLVSAVGGWGREFRGEVKIWNCKSFDEPDGIIAAEETFIAHEVEISSLTITPDSRTLVTGASDGKVSLWAINSGRQSNFGVSVEKITDLLGHTWNVLGLAVSNDGRLLATGDPDSVFLWNLDTTTKFGELPRATGEPLAFSRDDRTLVSGGGGNTFKLWNVVTQREIFTLVGHEGFPQDASFSPDGSILATGSADGTVRLW